MTKREWGDFKLSGYHAVCATKANIKGVASDEDNLFKELPFWLRIGPINWNNVEAPNGWMLGFDDYDDD